MTQIDIKNILPLRKSYSFRIMPPGMSENGYLEHIRYEYEDIEGTKIIPTGYYVNKSGTLWVHVDNLIDKLYEEVYTLRQTQYQEEKLFS